MRIELNLPGKILDSPTGLSRMLTIMLCCMTIVSVCAYFVHPWVVGLLHLSTELDVALTGAMASFSTFALVVFIYRKHLDHISHETLCTHGYCSSQHIFI